MNETLTAETIDLPVETEAPAVTQAEGTAPEAAATPDPPAKPAHEPWYQQRIRAQAAKLAFESGERERVARELDVTKAALARYEAQQRAQNPETPQPPQQPAATLTRADVEARAAELAEQRASASDFNQQCNSAYEAGQAAFPDFGAKLAEFNHLGGLGQHIDFVKDVISLPNGAHVLYALAGDLDHAAHVLALPPRQQAMALATLSTNLAGSAPVATATTAARAPVTASKAPPPIKPIAGRASGGSGDVFDTKQSMSDWVKAFDKKN
jgi:hypothetical protein